MGGEVGDVGRSVVGSGCGVIYKTLYHQIGFRRHRGCGGKGTRCCYIVECDVVGCAEAEIGAGDGGVGGICPIKVNVK